MVALVVLLVLLLLLIGVLQIRVGAEVTYDQSGVVAKVKIAGHSIVLFPRPKKTRSQLSKDKEKAEKKKAKKEKQAQKKALKKQRKLEKNPKPPEPEKPLKEKVGGAVDLVLSFLPIVVQALGALKRKIRINPLEIHLVASCPDAADTAVLYGKSYGAIGTILPLFEENFDVRNREITIDMDFLAGKTTIFIRAGLSFKVGQLLYIALRYGLAALKVFLQKKKQAKLAAREKKAATAQEEAKTDSSTEDTQQSAE